MEKNPGEAPSDDFLEQILVYPGYGGGNEANLAGNDAPAMLQLNSAHVGGMGMGLGVGAYGAGGFPLGLSLEQGKSLRFNDATCSGKRFHRGDILDSRGPSSLRPGFRGQPMANTVPSAQHLPAIRPRVRARRGQATDPHSIAERLRRERIAERIRALQDLVPSVNKTDRAAMLDEIVDYVKFLRLQVKVKQDKSILALLHDRSQVLSASRLGGAGAVAPLVTDIPLSAVEEEGTGGGRSQPAWEKWSNDGTERQVAKLMEENVGAAMQFLQSKALCIMPVSLASAIYHTLPLEPPAPMKPEPTPPL